MKTVKMFKCDLCEIKFKEENELEDHIQDWYCMECDLKLNCKDEYGFHDLKYSQEVNIREIENFLMSTCQCEDEHLTSCKVGNFIRIMKAHHGRHTKSIITQTRSHQ